MNKSFRQILISITFLVLACMAVNTLGSAQTRNPTAIVLTADGPVTPAMVEYLARGIRIAEKRGAEVLIFELNTPGGSIDLMNHMVQDIRASYVPVIVYVSPRGAIAGSAGTVITLAGHASAMAPETAIGAASPVGSEGQDLGETIESKQKNILKATVRSLAEHRGQAAIDLAEETIESAKAASAAEALQAGLIDFIANDLSDLLDQLDGYSVNVQSAEHTLSTSDALVTPIDQSLIEQILTILTNPNIVFLLLTIGVQSILIEISNPGGWAAGFIGVVCLALATYGLGILPVNWFGLVFLATAFVLFILDIKAPTHGALTAAGVASLIVGALVLFNSPTVPNFQRVSVPLVVATSMASGVLFFSIVLFALKAQRTPIRTGQESLLGKRGFALSELAPAGTVQVGGEQWSAKTMAGEKSIPKGTHIEVIEVKGVRLYVRPVSSS